MLKFAHGRLPLYIRVRVSRPCFDVTRVGGVFLRARTSDPARSKLGMSSIANYRCAFFCVCVGLHRTASDFHMCSSAAAMKPCRRIEDFINLSVLEIVARRHC